MNKLAYRLIFSQRRGMLVAVAEHVSSQGKGTQSGSAPGASSSSLMRLVHLAVAVAALFGGVTVVNAQIVADPNAGSRRPTVVTTANGLPQVNIVAPNASGLSHNQYGQFSVGSQGAILNNSATISQTQQAGFVQGNPNLTNGSARIILNEVTGTSRSQLNGYVEVAGQRAEVVIANPNGISVAGGGFINTSRGVLTTGTPVINSDGSLGGFKVTGGDIQIGSSGLNAANTDQLDLISRSVSVNGQIWANQLNVITGTNQVNYSDLGVQLIAGDNNKPTVSIDIAQLGGMYANKIRLVGSEAGVGVVSLGTVAAQAGDVNLDSQGKITLNGKTSATGGVTIHSADSVINTGTVYGQQAVQLSANGQIANSGTVAAQGDLTLFSGSINSTGVLGAGIDANSSASQAGSLNLIAADGISATGQNLAGANVAMNGANLNLAHSQTSAAGNVVLTARAGDIDHTGGNLQGAGATLSATGAVIDDQGRINVSQLTSNSASLSNVGGNIAQSGAGNTAITTTGALNNSAGAITTNAQNLTIQSGSLNNTAGQINHAGSGTATIQSGATTNVQGVIGTNGQLALTASSLNNQAGRLTSAGQSNIHVTGDIGNAQGTIQSGGALTVAGNNIDNTTGILSSLNADGLTLTASGQLTNAANGVVGGNGNVSLSAGSVVNGGKITASNNMTSAVAGSFDNSNGLLAAGKNLTASAASTKNANGTIDAANVALTIPQLDNSSGKITGDQLAIHTTNLTNQHGQISQFGSSPTTIVVAGILDNSNGGLLQSNGSDLSITSQALVNDNGTIAHAGTGTLTINDTGALSNKNGNIGTNGQMGLTAGSLNNQAGSITAKELENVHVAGDIVNAQGTIQSGGALTVAGANLDNTAGNITSLNADGLTLNASGQLTNVNGGVIGGNGDVALTAASAINGGKIIGSHNVTAIVANSFDNSNGKLAAGNAVTASAASLKNANGVVDAATVALTVPQLDNSSGKITADQLNIISTNLTNEHGQIIQYSTNATHIGVAGTLDNSNGGLIQVNSTDLSLTPQSLNNNGGTIALSGSGALTVNVANGAGNLSNVDGSIGSNGQATVSVASIANQGGSVFAQKQLNVTATQGGVDNSAGGYIGGSSLNLNAANGQINNTAGKIEGTQQAVTLNAQSLNNAGGTVQSIGAAPLNVTTAQAISNTVANSVGGFIGGSGAVNLNAGSFDNSGGTVYSKDNLVLQSNGALTNNYGVIQGAASVTTSAAGALNNVNGRIEANGSPTTLSVSGNGIDNTSGRIANTGTGLTQINGGSQVSNQQGTIGGNGELDINASNLDNSQQGQVIAGGNLVLNTGSTLNNNAGSLYAAQNVQLNQSGAAVTNVGGKIGAAGNTTLNVSSLDNTFGLIGSTSGAGSDIGIAANSFTNTLGTVASGRDLSVTAPTIVGNGKVVAGRDGTINLQGDYTNTAGNVLTANHNLTLSTTGNLTNTGTLAAVNSLTLNAANVDNQSTGLINSGATTVQASNAITNTGRIYGDDIALGTQSLTNDVDVTSGQAGAIAARNSINIGAATVVNREHAIIQSLSDMTFGRTLDVNHKAIGTAGSITNSSATIDAGGNLVFQTAQLNNTNAHFATTQQVDPTLTTQVTQYASWVAPTTWYNPNQVTWGDSGDGGIVLIDPSGGRFEKFYKQDYTQTVSKTVVTSSDPGKISSGGGMVLSGNITNDKSTIIAGGTLSGTTGNINNIGATGEIDTVNHMTANENYYHYVNGHPHENHYDYDNGGAAYDVTLPSTPLALNVWTVQQNTAPNSGANPALGQGVGATAVPTVGGLTLGVNQGSQTVTGASGHGVTTAGGTAGSGTGIGGSNQGVAAAGGTAGSGTSTTGSNQTIGSAGNPLPNLVLPNNRLFTIQSNPGQHYLVATDPAFTNYGTFLSSDYMLGQLGINPQTTEKRLGDGFYEAQVVTNQVAQLTGKRFLDGYASNEDEYKALMDAGVATAKQFQLTPGIALTAEQMASLTSDIVWMVSQDVTLPDGSHTQVLAPVVYLTRADAGDISPTGALISGKDIDLTINGTLKNGGTLQASNNMIVQATDIANTGNIRSTGANGSAILVAQNDILNNGGNISGHRVGILAGRDVTMSTDTVSATGAQGTNIALSRVASVNADQLSIQAGRDINLVAAAVNTTGDAQLSAGRDLNLTAVNTQRSYNVTYNADNHLYENQTQLNGTTINAGGKLALIAGQDINAAAAYATAGGQLEAVAGRDVNIGTAQQSNSLDQAIYTTSHGMFSSSTSRSQRNDSGTQAIGSTLSGDSVIVQAGRDIGVTGSNIVGTHDVSLNAANSVTITTSQNTSKSSSSSEEKTSGMFSSGGVGVTMGSKEQQDIQTSQQLTNNGSTIGSTDGNISINAGKTYTQTGSDVLAPKGDIGIAAQQVNITTAIDTMSATEDTKAKQSGLSLTLTSPVISAIQTAQQMNRAAGQSKDKRMQVLASTAAGLSSYDAYNAVSDNPSQAGGVSVSLSVGGSQSQSHSEQTSSTAKSSNVAAGGDVIINATGAGKASNINVTGSNITAGNNATLNADGTINLQAAQSTDAQHSTNSSSSASIGIGFSLGGQQNGFTLNAGVSGGRGNADGTDSANVNTHVTAGNQFALNSGGDTNMKGAVASGKQVTANVGGNLNVESLQDTSVYDSKQTSAGVSVSICIPPFCYGTSSASGNFSNSKANNNYQSVTEQSGIKAGDGGFTVNVNGNTDLKGGVIASTDKAVQDTKNSFTTGTLTTRDIQNKSNASADSVGVSLSSDMFTQGKYGASKGVISNALSNGSESGSSSGKTLSAISAGTVNITNDQQQKTLTGSGAAETVASLNRDTANSQTSAQRQDVQAMQQEAQAAQTIKQTLITQATKFTDEAYRTAFLKSADVYVVEKDADGVVTARQLSDEEKQNLQPAADGKVHVADNGIFNDLDGATKYADQHSSAVDGPQYLIHFDIANNALSELMIAGYQKYLEGDVMGLTNATQETKSVMQQYGENGLVLDGHSRGAMTVGNAMESMQNQPDAQGSLSDTLVHFYGPAYNAVKADNILGNLQNRDAISDPTQKNNMVLTYENNIADPVGRLIGGNPPTGGTIPDGSSILFQALRAATGQPVTSHNCYGASGNENCGKFWQDSPTMTPVPQAVRHY